MKKLLAEIWTLRRLLVRAGRDVRHTLLGTGRGVLLCGCRMFSNTLSYSYVKSTKGTYCLEWSREEISGQSAERCCLLFSFWVWWNERGETEAKQRLSHKRSQDLPVLKSPIWQTMLTLGNYFWAKIKSRHSQESIVQRWGWGCVTMKSFVKISILLSLKGGASENCSVGQKALRF